jgi:large subunit ribosomal protein L3
VVGITKVKGFPGVVKRHGFSGVAEVLTGSTTVQRQPVSMGASSFPSRVLPGKRLPGRTGGDRVKIINLRVLKVIPESNLYMLKVQFHGQRVLT